MPVSRVSMWCALALAGCSGAPLQPAGSAAPPTDPVLQAIDEEYVASVKPLFARSCTHCHGAGQALPWYHALPWVRGLIDDDIARARRAIDMSHDFPFGGRGAPAALLEAVGGVVDDDSMPPARYRALHWGAAPSAAEKQTVQSWVERSLERLRERGPAAR